MIEPRYRRFNYHPTCSQQLTNTMLSKACLIFALLFAICEAIPDQFRPVYGQTPFHVPTGDVVDVAVGAGEFTILAKIVTDLGLVDTLKNAEALTIFAPNDKAFAKLPAGTLESLTPEQVSNYLAGLLLTLVSRLNVFFKCESE